MSFLLPFICPETGATLYQTSCKKRGKNCWTLVEPPAGKRLVRWTGDLFLYEDGKRGELQWWRYPRPEIRNKRGAVILVPESSVAQDRGITNRQVDCKNRVWSIEDDGRRGVWCGDRRIRETIPPVKELHCVWNGNGERVVAETFNWRFYVFNCVEEGGERGRGKGRPKFEHDLKPWRRMKHERVKCFVISPDHRTLAYSYTRIPAARGVRELIHLTGIGGKTVRHLNSPCRAVQTVEKLCFSPNGRWLYALCVGFDGWYFVCLWHLPSERNAPMRIVHPKGNEGRRKADVGPYVLQVIAGYVAFGVLLPRRRACLDIEPVPQ